MADQMNIQIHNSSATQVQARFATTCQLTESAKYVKFVPQEHFLPGD